MTDYAEEIRTMRESQHEILDAIEARAEVEFHGFGSQYAELVLETAKVFSVLRLFAIVERQFQSQFVEAGSAVLICGIYRVNDKLVSEANLPGLTGQQEKEFMDTVHMLSNKQLKFFPKENGD